MSRPDPRALTLIALPFLAGLLAACAGTPTAGEAPVALATAEGLHLIEHDEDACALCEIYSASQDWVVRIETATGQGTGIVVASDGRVVTNAHVVGAEGPLSVETADGVVFAARRLHFDSDEDLALIQVERADRSFRPASIRSGALPRIGSDVYAIGHPLGLGWSVTRGIVSAHRDIGPLPMVQTDAPISPGNSGGPLLDTHGHVIGIVTSKVAGVGAENLAFARPVPSLLGFLEACDVPLDG